MAEDKFVTDHKTETYKSLITISVEGYKYLGLLNGGAIIALLTVGNGAKDSQRVLHAMAPAMPWLIGSLIVSGLCFFVAYLVQLSLHGATLSSR